LGHNQRPPGSRPRGPDCSVALKGREKRGGYSGARKLPEREALGGYRKWCRNSKDREARGAIKKKGDRYHLFSGAVRTDKRGKRKGERRPEKKNPHEEVDGIQKGDANVRWNLRWPPASKEKGMPPLNL